MRAPERDDPGVRQRWAGAAALALGGHALLLGAVLLWSRKAPAPESEPVVLVELPEGAAAAPSPSAADAPSPAQAQTASTSRMTSEPVEQPSARVQPDPLPMVRPAVQAAPIQPVVAAPAPTPPRPAPPAGASGPSAPARTVSAGSASTGDGPGTSPAARKAQQDYYAMIAAHLQRRKTYPPEARKARQQGIVTVHFTVARDGSVSAVSIKRSSGHELLDGATLDLMQRVAPLPRMPASMEKDSVTLSLPIEYSLRTE